MAVLAACNSQPVDLEHARSAMRSARSYAAESELLAESALQGRVPARYAEEHAQYLAGIVRDSEKELLQSAPRPEAADLIQECRLQLGALAAGLSDIRAGAARGDRGTLSTAREQIENVRVKLQRLDQAP